MQYMQKKLFGWLLADVELCTLVSYYDFVDQVHSCTIPVIKSKIASADKNAYINILCYMM